MHQWISVMAPAAGELIKIQCCSREEDFDPCHHDSPSVWFTTKLLALYCRPAWLNYIFAPEILLTLTKAFLECSYQASLFTSLMLRCLHFQHQIHIRGIRNTHPEHEARGRGLRSLGLSLDLFPQCCFPLHRVDQKQCPDFGKESLRSHLTQASAGINANSQKHNSFMPFCFFLEC